MNEFADRVIEKIVNKMYNEYGLSVKGEAVPLG